MSGPILTAKEAAEFTGFAEATLRRWRCVGKGPRFLRWGNTIRYLRTDLLAWMAEGRKRSAA
jgi:predicted DNA-binding transcriptional regulator AlpA